LGLKTKQRLYSALLKDDAELYKQFSDNPDFKRWLTDMVFSMTYGEAGRDLETQPS
jgi:type I restriction enzyme R subunit